MKIYTKKGDQGETGLFGGSRVKKTHLRIEAYGTLDELNSVLGVARAALVSTVTKGHFEAPLHAIQNDLFQLGAELATPPGKPLTLKLVETLEIEALETLIDYWEETLPPLKTFILPGGSALAANLHVARTVCRRAERCTVHLSSEETVRGEVLAYLNRLSDLLFVMARKANAMEAVAEIPWDKQ